MEISLNIPDSKSGDWEIKNFTVSEKDAERANMYAACHPGGRYIQPGSYVKLLRRGYLVMSNTPAEIDDHYWLHRATGNILISGLGLGMCVQALLKKPEVTKITVLEISQDVINLVSPTITDPRVEIIHSDALTFKIPKGVRYDYVWHDIWDDICVDNLETMTKLKRKFARRTSWQGCWCQELCRRYRGY